MKHFEEYEDLFNEQYDLLKSMFRVIYKEEMSRCFIIDGDHRLHLYTSGLLACVRLFKDDDMIEEDISFDEFISLISKENRKKIFFNIELFKGNWFVA